MHSLNLQLSTVVVALVPLIWMVRLSAADNQIVFNTLARYYWHACIEFAARCRLCSIGPTDLGGALMSSR